MSRKNKIKIFKTILLIFVLILLVGIILYLFPVIKRISTKEGQIEFKGKVDRKSVV